MYRDSCFPFSSETGPSWSQICAAVEDGLEVLILLATLAKCVTDMPCQARFSVLPGSSPEICAGEENSLPTEVHPRPPEVFCVL